MTIILDNTFLYDVQLPGDKILGLARFLLGVGVPGNAKDLYHQIEALASLENNRLVAIYFIFPFSVFLCFCLVSVKCCVLGSLLVELRCSIVAASSPAPVLYLHIKHFLKCRVSIPLILSLPTSVLSLTRKDQLKVWRF